MQPIRWERATDVSVRRVLVRRWVRGALSIGVLLAIPAAYPRLERALDPQRERLEMAQAAEERQRAAGETFVTASGATRRAVVYTPVHPSRASEAALQRGLVWWSRLLAAITALGLLAGTWRTLRSDGPRERTVA